MDEKELLAELEETGALRRGHFKLSSGRHSDAYIQCALLLKNPETAVEVGRSIAEKVDSEIDLVLSPALGAIVIGFTTALSLGCDMVFAERRDGEMMLRRGFEIESGSRVLVVEDVITTGSSAMELVDIAEDTGASVVGIACVVLRGDIKGGPPVVSLTRLELDLYVPDECPMCASGRPVDAPGSRYRS